MITNTENIAPEYRLFYSPDMGSGCIVLLYEGDFWIDLHELSHLLGVRKRIVKGLIRKLFRRKYFGPGNIHRFRVRRGDEGLVVTHYNLNVISHTGYLLNVPVTEAFRRWAMQIRIKEAQSRYSNTTAFTGSVRAGLSIKDASGSSVLVPVGRAESHLSGLLTKDFDRITYREAILAIRRIKRKYGSHRYFALEKGNAFRSALNVIYQTYDGRDLYPSIEEKGAHLLYFVLKHQSFFDGNKRIGLFMFIWFLHRNKLLYNPDKRIRFADDDFLHLIEYVSASSKAEKSAVISTIMKFIMHGGFVE